jgi:hypothetical protein
MLFKKLILIFLPFLFILDFFAQKKIIDHKAYNSWNTITDINISNNGKYSTYVVKPLKGDSYLYIVNNLTEKKDSILRGVEPVFSYNSNYLAFKIKPTFDTLRKCELSKTKKEKWPKDSLGIYFFENDSLIKFPKIDMFKLDEKSDWIAYLKTENVFTSIALKQKRRKKKVEKQELISDGKLLVYFDPISNNYIEYNNVVDFGFSENKEISYHVSHFKKNKVDSFSIYVNNFSEKYSKKLPKSFINAQKFIFNKSASDLVFLASNDTSTTLKIYELYHYNLHKKTLININDTIKIDSTLAINEKSRLFFLGSSNRLYFGVSEKQLQIKDTLLDSEKAVLDIWSHNDLKLQPQQLKELKSKEAKSILCLFDIDQYRFNMICSDTFDYYISDNKDLDYSIASYTKPYESSYQWDSPWKKDLYRLNLLNGEMKLLQKEAIHHYSLSPSASFLTFFNKGHLYLLNIVNNISECITCNVNDEWLEDNNGIAETPGLVTSTNWIRGNDKKETGFIIHSQYNVYHFDISKNRLKLIPFNENKQDVYKIQRILQFEKDSSYFNPLSNYVKVLNSKNKSESLYSIDFKDNEYKLVEKYQINEAILTVKKAKNNDNLVFQKQSNSNFPDVYFSNWTSFNDVKKISYANPQQKEYNWSTVELVEWKNYESVILEGLIYKPEDFDVNKKYPLIVYYYELNSDGLHRHYAPKPTASVIHPTEYASSGYIVFIPDIRYKLGYPAKGAYSCVMSGTDYILKKYPQIDSTKMGLQGQSWGGYQSAQLITMTKRYKAAMAGAPVSNMFSAYGGIRWGSGLNRQFQYEKTQSRIGKTIWEAPELYVENSPLFHLPKVETPLLIMHNDMDGAVPWYQGIELFTGLKRLGKPVWMLNYNGDDHNLTKLANKIDLSIRMKQFFDHYLMEKPAPLWMKDGIPAIQKGKNYGLEIK